VEPGLGEPLGVRRVDDEHDGAGADRVVLPHRAQVLTASEVVRAHVDARDRELVVI
jgi:hypothetical protein